MIDRQKVRVDTAPKDQTNAQDSNSPPSNKREKWPTMYQTKPQQRSKKANKNKEMGYQHCIFCALIVCVLSASPPSPDHPRLNHHSHCWLLPSHSSNGHTQITANLSPSPPLPTQRLIIMLITPHPIPSNPSLSGITAHQPIPSIYSHPASLLIDQVRSVENAVVINTPV